MFKQAVIAALLLAGVAASTNGQAYRRWYAPRRIGYGYGLGYGLGYGGYGYGVGSSVSLQQQAIAQTIQAQGEYLQSASAAMINAEQARSQYIDNQKEWTQVYMERKRALQTLTAEKEAATRAQHERTREYYASLEPQPPVRLSSSQLDPSTGSIHWPDALSKDAFQAERKELDDLFALRAKTDTIPGLSEKIDSAVADMKVKLRDRIRDIDTQDYIAARKFLDAMAVEGRSVTD